MTDAYSLDAIRRIDSEVVLSQTYHDKLTFYEPAMTQDYIQANCDMEIEIQTQNWLIPWLWSSGQTTMTLTQNTVKQALCSSFIFSINQSINQFRFNSGSVAHTTKR